jgi:hypothetical protein
MALRWLVAVVLAVFLTPSHDAEAQAFKPRGGAKAPAKGAKKTTTKKASTPKKGAKKKTSRAARAKNEDAESESRKDPDEDADDFVRIEDDDE